MRRMVMGEFQRTAEVYAVGQGTASLVAPVIQTRIPTASDSKFELGQVWIDKTNDGAYALTSLTSTAGIVSATWTSLGSATGDLDTLTTDDATVVSATSGTIIVAGTAGELVTTGANSPGTVTIAFDDPATFPGALTVTGLFTAEASAVIDTAGTALNLATDVDTAAVNIGTAAAARTITVGNVTGATAVNVNTGTGGFAVATTGAGDIVLNSADTVLVDGAGVVEINSSAGVISIGNDAVNQNINVGTAGTRTISIGSATATETILGACNINASGSAITTIGTGGTGAVNIGNATGNTSVTGSLTATTTLTATLGDITATNGNLVLVAAGNKINRTSVATTTAAGDNAAGTVTLVGGTATVSTTAVNSASLIRLSRMSVGATGAAALGELSVGTIVNGTSFVINAWQQADATALQASDVSSIYWDIVN
jgi:hypothetical protein